MNIVVRIILTSSRKDQNCNTDRTSLMYTVFSLAVFHRGFRRLRQGTRSSVKVLPQQHGPYCGRLKIYRPRWADRQLPGKNWKRTSLIGLVRG